MCATDQNVSTALKYLKSKLCDIVHVDWESIHAASFDGLKAFFSPSAVIRPNESTQVGIVLELANEFCIPVTTKGAGSSLTGGATPIKGGWVLDLSLLNEIQIDV